jgi:hypothetical protein
MLLSMFNSVAALAEAFKEITALNCISIQLIRWAQAVDVYGDQTLERTGSTAENQIINDTLLQIMVLFSDAEKILKKYRLNPNDGAPGLGRAARSFRRIECEK